MRTILAILTSLVTLVVSACVGSASREAPTVPNLVTVRGELVAVEGGAYSNVSPDELAQMLQSKDFIFINVHVPYEGEIEQTDQFIAYEEAGPQRVSDYPEDKATKIVLYCRSGRMSSIVAAFLVKAGYTNVWNLDGGMIAWEDAGYSLIHI